MDLYEYNLKKQDKTAGRKNTNIAWSIQNIEAGFEKFYDERGHYPSVNEIDGFEYLPSSRQIQRIFGGVQALRKAMNLKNEAPDHHSGLVRSNTAAMTGKRASDYEEIYYKYLSERIPEICIHEQKALRHNGHKTDTDYFLYQSESGKGVAIDLFFADYIQSLLKQVSIKLPKYQIFPYKVYFVCVNLEIKQEEIDLRLKHKKTTLPTNIEVYNLNVFNQKVLPGIAEVANRFIHRKHLKQYLLDNNSLQE